MHVKLFGVIEEGLRGLLVFGRWLTFFEWLKQCETDTIDKHLLGVRVKVQMTNSFLHFELLDEVQRRVGRWCFKEVISVTSPVAEWTSYSHEKHLLSFLAVLGGVFVKL